jgi:hypothetical protein
MHFYFIAVSAFYLLFASIISAGEPGDYQKAPFDYVWGTAYHILEETTNMESGYFSLNQGLNGKIYIGTAKYNENAFLVEFDPETEKQRIVINAQQACGLTSTGYAAQSKIHTRNYVGKSGTIYTGTKQGYKKKGDKTEYPGGYVIAYNPSTQKTKCLGMPYAGQGVIDIVADESRNLLYVVTCEDQHWMLGNITNQNYKELGVILTPYATTLIDGKGRANAITKDYKLAQYDPETEKLIIRPIMNGDNEFANPKKSGAPTWALSKDGHTAYLIFMRDPALFSIDLYSKGKTVKAKNYGKMTDGVNPDSRCALSIAPDGRIYMLIREDNTTGFGKNYLHILHRFDPETEKKEQLGVIAVKNPDFFNFEEQRRHGKKWIHGYHTLPDGTLTPKYHHMALMVADDNTVYVTVIYPFTLLKINKFKTKQKKTEKSAAAEYLNKVLEWCSNAEQEIPKFVKAGEIIAEKYENGGAIGTWWQQQCLGPELYGRAGNIIHIGFDRTGIHNRTAQQQANDVALFGFDQAPTDFDKQKFDLCQKKTALL